MKRILPIFLGLALLLAGPLPAPAQSVQALPPHEARAWIEAMKQAPRGPFIRLRWYCNDGTVKAPKAYACTQHGGGHQHGEWSAKAKELRANGYLIANFLAGVDAAKLVAQADFPEIYNQLLLEQFLVRQDDGWILRQARFYRGAYQIEDEAAGARDLLRKLVAESEWTGRRFLQLRIGARLLPWQAGGASIVRIRQDSTALAEKEPGFLPLKNKIHNRPDAEDAQRVRDYAAGMKDPALASQFEVLAETIDAVYQSDRLRESMQRLQQRLPASEPLAGDLQQAAERLFSPEPEQLYAASARLLAQLRERLPALKSADRRLDALQLSLEAELAHYRAATELAPALRQDTRAADVALLGQGLEALYGVGLISRRQLKAGHTAIQKLSTRQLTAASYKRELDYLAHVPAWSSRWLELFFGATVQRWESIEPLVDLFSQDQLRGSPLLFYSKVLDRLLIDANQVLGVQHQFFGETLGSGLRALNPGLARGILRLPAPGEAFEADGIYLLPHTTAELQPVAGILTAGEGNPLSHVQLLARNLGIPNVAVDDNLVPKVKAHAGKRAILAVSPGGSVRLEEDRGQLERVFARQDSASEVLIRPDLKKLDLAETAFLTLDQLRASDSGRVVGPKAAKLAELRHHFPDAVAQGLAIPFGDFRRLLDQPMPGESGRSVFAWMQAEYARLEQLPKGSPQRAEATEAFRQRLQDWVRHADPGPDFKRRVRARLGEVFGPDGSYGVFVRSDTNVEDLPGFTGAGLNLTVPNVVGFDNILHAISRVWASPFSQRAFAWRQSRMTNPEAVYPAVLLLHSVPSEKSGVLVTQDIDTGDRDWLSVAVQEGVGGAVDGEATESLRIDTKTGEVRLLAQATAPLRTVLQPSGGVARVPASDSDRVLSADEIRQLIALAKALPKRFPPIVDAAGKPAPADIEFGFVKGRLQLYQLRPFLESSQAQRSDYLSQLDQGLYSGHDRPLDLQRRPLGGNEK